MCNLYGLISSKPKKLFEVPDNQGDNIEWLNKISQRVDDVIFCWGDFKGIDYRAKKVVELFPKAKCFGLNKSGSPIHPMAMMYGGINPDDTKLEPYAGGALKKYILHIE